MKYIINANAIVLFHDNKTVRVDKGTPEYNSILATFELSEEEQDTKIAEILNRKYGQFSQDGFTLSPAGVEYNGESLPEVLADKVRSLASENLPIKLIAKFWDNLNNNPSASSVRELYDFLSYKELPITEDGCFIAYKGVSRNGYSIHGNTTTKVIKGIVDNNGRIQNNVGDTIEVKRWDVDDNRDNSCSFGLHVGSLDYAKGFANGRCLVVKVNPADVVSVPTDCSAQKCRVAKYEVIDTFTTELTCAITDEDGNPLEGEELEAYNDLRDRIESYLDKQWASGVEVVPVQKIQNSFSPDYPSRVRVVDAVNDLGYAITKDENDKYHVLIS